MTLGSIFVRATPILNPQGFLKVFVSVVETFTMSLSSTLIIFSRNHRTCTKTRTARLNQYDIDCTVQRYGRHN